MVVRHHRSSAETPITRSVVSTSAGSGNKRSFMHTSAIILRARIGTMAFASGVRGLTPAAMNSINEDRTALIGGLHRRRVASGTFQRKMASMCSAYLILVKSERPIFIVVPTTCASSAGLLAALIGPVMPHCAPAASESLWLRPYWPVPSEGLNSSGSVQQPTGGNQ